jgi:hypothetical protein
LLLSLPTEFLPQPRMARLTRNFAMERIVEARHTAVNALNQTTRCNRPDPAILAAGASY